MLKPTLSTLQQTDLLSLPVTIEAELSEIIKSVDMALAQAQTQIFTFVNPYAYHVAYEDSAYLSNLRQFDGVFADGIGVVWAGRLLGLGKIPRVSFDSTSLAPAVFKYCATNGHKIYLIGGAEGVADRAAKVLGEAFPGLSFAGYQSGYFDNPQDVFQAIQDSGARVVICGMGLPRQESFLVELKQSDWRGIGFTCGGYLDQLGEGLHYYPAWVDRLNLRFAYRLLDEPGRLWKRYLVQYGPFLIAFIRTFLRRLVGR